MPKNNPSDRNRPIGLFAEPENDPRTHKPYQKGEHNPISPLQVCLVPAKKSRVEFPPTSRFLDLNKCPTNQDQFTVAETLPVAKTSGGHWSSVRCQVLSGLYRSMFFTILSDSGPRSFS